MHGMHLTADIAGCGEDQPLMTDARLLSQTCLRLVKRSGLTAVSQVFHAFPEAPDGQPGGITGTVLLAESHLAIHTWPELSAVTLDVYVCNFSQDNSDKASRLLESLIDAFAPSQVQRQQLQRGAVGLPATL